MKLFDESEDLDTWCDAVMALTYAMGLSGQCSVALPLLQRALKARERALGVEHVDTLKSVNNLASLYEGVGEYEHARLLYERAREARERVLSSEHPDTLASINNLAFVYERTGEYERARSLYEHVLEVP